MNKMRYGLMPIVIFVTVLLLCITFVAVRLHFRNIDQKTENWKKEHQLQRETIRSFLETCGGYQSPNAPPIWSYIANVELYFQGKLTIDEKYEQIKKNYILILATSAPKGNDVFLLPLNFRSKGWPLVTYDYSMLYPYGEEGERIFKSINLPMVVIGVQRDLVMENKGKTGVRKQE